MPKRPAGAPKLAHVRIAKFPAGGFQVHHVMTHGPKPVPFVFADPKKMVQHLRRIDDSEWRHPEKDSTRAMVHGLDIATSPSPRL